MEISGRLILMFKVIEQCFAKHGDKKYGEFVTQRQHALQCAMLASQEGSSSALIAASLLHDIGHMLDHSIGSKNPGEDLVHEVTGADFLAQWFPKEVTEPVRLHVVAKRFLTGNDIEYYNTLSPASKHSLDLQGGPMSADAQRQFLNVPFAKEAIQLRRWDDQAKETDLDLSLQLSDFRELLESLANREFA
jgi:phosphonate degradation associated HDIG domain protein